MVVLKTSEKLDLTTWDEISSAIAHAFRMTETETVAFRDCNTARFIAALPFLAGCEHPYRTALAHLATYTLASFHDRGCCEIFDHAPNDDKDVFARLEPISHFSGGDRHILQAGMARLALTMVAGYQRDQAKDSDAGQYNPLNSKAWDFQSKLIELRIIADSGNPVLDDFMPVEKFICGWWIL
jgi:hypothetical protein